jgi:tetratricopeptide (TPR) repeat protein
MTTGRGQTASQAAATEKAHEVRGAFARALASHQKGFVSDAQTLYREILRIIPDHFDALHLLGVSECQSGRLEESERFLRQALVINSQSAAAHSNLGNLLVQSRRFDEALASFDRAIALKPDYAEAFFNRGNTFGELGRFEEAVASYDRAIALKPDYAEAFGNRGNALRELQRPTEALDSCDTSIALKPDFAEAWNNRANALRELHRLNEALASYDKALTVKPDFAEAHRNRGIVLLELGCAHAGLASFNRAISLNPNSATAFFHRGDALMKLRRPAEALESYDRAVDLDPGDAAAFNNRGNALRQLERLDEAVASYDAAIKLRPDCANAFSNRGAVLPALKRFEEALASCDAAIALEPGYVEALSNRGNILQELKRFDDALASYDEAIALKPEFADAFNNRGAALKELLRMDEALESYNRAIALNPGNADGYRNRAYCKLLAGQLREGWHDYEWRWESTDFLGQRPNIAVPYWQGEDLAGRNLLVFAEQGLGDVIQFSRYLPLLSEKKCNVTFLTDEKLLRLLQPLMRQVRFFTDPSEVGDIDYQVAIMSLPFWFETSLDTIPATVPYLHPLPERVAKWRERLPSTRALRIGLAWSGNRALKNDANRSIPLGRLKPFLTDERIEFISLVRDLRDEDAPLLDGSGILNLGDELGDFADTAAVISLLDLVVSVDTSVAHLAGAMAKPVWILLPFSPDWRWMLGRSDSPWYPTARLFRQSARDDWTSVLSRVERELSFMAENAVAAFPVARPDHHPAPVPART